MKPESESLFLTLRMIGIEAARAQNLRLLDSSLHNSDSSFDVRDTKALTCLTSSFKSPRVAKTVRFCEVTEIHEIETQLEIDEKEKSCLWYRAKDYKRIKKEGQITIQLIRDGKLIRDYDEHCLLGLDNETHLYARQRSLHKLMVKAIVFDEQEYQREYGYNDPLELAEKSHDFVSRCRHAAFVAGLRTDRTPRRGYIN